MYKRIRRSVLNKLNYALTAIVIIIYTLNGCGFNSNNTAEAPISTDNSVIQDQTNSSNKDSNILETISDDAETESKDSSVTIKLTMIGDVLVHEGVYKSGYQKDGTYNFDHLFKYIKPDLKESDINVVNQETILGGTELGLSSYPRFNSPYEIGDAEVSAGFNVILHATNHTVDKGLSGVTNCLNFWHEKYPDIFVLGIHKDFTDYENIRVYEKDGFRIAMLNYTYGTNGLPIPKANPYCVDLYDKEKVIQDIKKAKECSDMVVVFPHWGTEYQYVPSSVQDEWTDLFLSQQVDLVIGTHPHVLQPVELLTDDTGHNMLVYYSLGNFVSNQDKKDRMIGGMAKVTLKKENGSSRITEYSLEPLVTHKLYGRGLITTYKLSDYNDTLAKNNSIIYDSGCSDFSYSYCHTLALKILGHKYDTSTGRLYVELSN